jgi:CubicO group peptidase (beta-lactamase class C family)
MQLFLRPKRLRHRPTRFFLLFIILALVAGDGISSIQAWAEQPQRPTPDQLKKILDDFENYAEQAQKDWQVPGMAIAIVQDDKVIFAKGFGVKKVGGNDKVDKHTIFQIGSTSKAFTATLVGMMVDEKKLAWQDRVVDRLEQFQMFDPWVTREFQVADLMAQHSGLPQFAGDGQAFMGFDRAHIIHSLRYLKPVSSFRSQYAYQNGLFLVAAALVEKYTGKSWEDNLKARLLEPLGMTSITAGLEGFKEAKNVTFLHEKTGDHVEPIPSDWPYHNWVYIYGPAGGINSNVLDMTKWLQLQLDKGKVNGKQLISKANLDFLQTPKTIMGTDPSKMAYYCEAWVYQPFHPCPIIWHNGGTSGNKTMVAFMPEVGLGIVVLSNLITNLPESLAFQFFDLYFHNPPRDWSKERLEDMKQAEAKDKPPPRPASPAPPLPFERYASTFDNPVYGQFTIIPEQDKLYMVFGQNKHKVLLQPFDRDWFTFTWLNDLSSAVFTIGPDGWAQSMLVDWDGGTEFKRVEAKPGS